jgi:hypothetical protein
MPGEDEAIERSVMQRPEVQAWLDEQDRVWTNERRSAFLTSCLTSSRVGGTLGAPSSEDSAYPFQPPTGGSRK